jgi:hypothetical protein
MIVVRNVFKIRFGKARDALAVWKEAAEMHKKFGLTNSRVMTDVVGPSYTLVFETTHESISAWETTAREAMSNPEWKTWYQKFTPLAESGYREIFTIVE